MQGIDPISPSSYSQRHVTPTVASKKWNVPLYLQPQPTIPYLITELRSLWLSKKKMVRILNKIVKMRPLPAMHIIKTKDLCENK